LYSRFCVAEATPWRKNVKIFIFKKIELSPVGTKRLMYLQLYCVLRFTVGMILKEHGVAGDTLPSFLRSFLFKYDHFQT
jgi:hypothetical protein